MDPEQRFQLVLSVGEECLKIEELQNLVAKKPGFILYDGFEPSGRLHIAQGLFKAINVNKCTKGGGKFIFWVADWFALMNDKMGGDLEKIRVVGQYLIEVWKAAGMDMENVEFRWSSDDINRDAAQYWPQMLDIARRFTVARITKCGQIMGRKEGNLTSAQILYPLMQCTDIFYLKADVCQLGLDQRKVNMLAREYCEFIGRKLKPVILSHHMMYGLKAGQEKMSKSDPQSAIFMEDDAETVERKIRLAWCPRTPVEAAAAGPKDDEVEEEEGPPLTTDDLKNPVLDYIKCLIFSQPGKTIIIGDKEWGTFNDVKDAFVAEVISEDALKEALIIEINKMIDPVREHLQNCEAARDVAERVRGWVAEAVALKDAAVKFPPSPPSESIEHKAEAAVGPVVVIAPVPTGAITVEQVVSVHERLLVAADEAAAKGQSAVLYLPDWSAFTKNCLEEKKQDQQEKVVRAWYEVFVSALRALDMTLLERVQVKWQSETILLDPDTYWIQVINAGRQISLRRVQQAEPSAQDSEDGKVPGRVHGVITALMHIGDVLGLKAGSLCDDGSHEALDALAIEYCRAAGKPFPSITKVPLPTLCLRKPGDTAPYADQNLLIFDTEADVDRKLKKTFCAPGDVAVCPPINLAKHLAFARMEQLTITRSAENGGVKDYRTVQDLAEDFQSEKLHPSELKPVVAACVNTWLAPIRNSFQTPNNAAAVSALKAALKKLK